MTRSKEVELKIRRKDEMQMLKPGFYVAENDENVWREYKIVMKVEETTKSYIFHLIEFRSNYSGGHIKMLFKNSERAIVRKKGSGHAMRVWSDEDFTIYPYQAGTPYWFQRVKEDL